MPFSREKHAKSNRKAFSSPISQENVPILAGTLRWAQFLSDEKLGKESPKAGPSPALWNPPRGTGWVCNLLCSALGRVGSHRWHDNSLVSASFYGKYGFYPQGLTLVCNCSQLPEVWLPAAGTPLLQSRPGGGNHPVMGPVAMVAWCGGRDRGHSKGDGPNTSLTH